MASFLQAAQKEGICVEYSESFNRNDPRSKIQQVAEVIRRFIHSLFRLSLVLYYYTQNNNSNYNYNYNTIKM